MGFFSGGSGSSGRSPATTLIQRQLERLQRENLMDRNTDAADSAQAVIDLVAELSPASLEQALDDALDGVTQAVVILVAAVMQRNAPLATRSLLGLALSRILQDDFDNGPERSEEELALMRSAGALLLQFNEIQRGHHRIINGG